MVLQVFRQPRIREGTDLTSKAHIPYIESDDQARPRAARNLEASFPTSGSCGLVLWPPKGIRGPQDNGTDDAAEASDRGFRGTGDMTGAGHGLSQLDSRLARASPLARNSATLRTIKRV